MQAQVVLAIDHRLLVELVQVVVVLEVVEVLKVVVKILETLKEMVELMWVEMFMRNVPGTYLVCCSAFSIFCVF